MEKTPVVIAFLAKADRFIDSIAKENNFIPENVENKRSLRVA